MDFKNMSDAELAGFMADFIKRVKTLEWQLAEYLDWVNRTPDMNNTIRTSYRQLKTELQEYGHYVSLRKNKNGSILYKACFVPSISEADIWGFSCAKNSKISIDMLRSVEEAAYKLSKYKMLKEWESLM